MMTRNYADYKGNKLDVTYEATMGGVSITSAMYNGKALNEQGLNLVVSGDEVNVTVKMSSSLDVDEYKALTTTMTNLAGLIDTVVYDLPKVSRAIENFL